MKLKKVVSDLQQRLSLAIQALQLDVSIGSDDTLKMIESTTQNIDTTTQNIDTTTSNIDITTRDTASNVESLLAAQQAAQFQKVLQWLSSPDPWTNHRSARKLHELHTGDWLLQSTQYKGWKSGHTRHLCLFGKSGCGKTLLSSTVIEDLKLYCEGVLRSCLAVFYFSFSDTRKQSSEDLLRSLIAQLAEKEPAQSIASSCVPTS